MNENIAKNVVYRTNERNHSQFSFQLYNLYHYPEINCSILATNSGDEWILIPRTWIPIFQCAEEVGETKHFIFNWQKYE